MTASKPQQSPAAPLSVRIPEAARLTGLGRSRRPELMKSGDIQFARVGGSTLIMVESLRSLSRPAEPEDRAGQSRSCIRAAA